MDRERTIKLIITSLVAFGIIVGGYFILQAKPEPTDGSRIILNNQGSLATNEQEMAVSLAEKYVQSMEGFKQLSGKNLELSSATRENCADCWKVGFSFLYEEVGEITVIHRATAQVEIENWEVAHAYIDSIE